MPDRPQKIVGDVRSARTETSNASNEKRKRRLDEILIDQGLISEAEVREALLRQKAYGGRFGSQLLCLGYIDEAGLVEALSTQLGCPGAVLSDLKIPRTVFSLVPQEVALARKVIPFEHDGQRNILKIACEDPTDQNLIKELRFVVRRHEIELYAAAEIALDTAIAKHYLGRDMSWHDAQLRETFGTATEISEQPVRTQVDRAEVAGPAVLLITDEEHTSPLLQSLLERDNYRVVITHSSDEAISLLRDEKFHTIFLKETVSVDYADLIRQVREVSPETVIRHYKKASSLLLGTGSPAVDGDLLLKDVDLFTSLLCRVAKLPVNHSGKVGRYAGHLCRRLELPDGDRLTITRAGYIHDLAKFYYGADEAKDGGAVIRLTAKLLKSLDYPSELMEVLCSMYVTLPKKHSGQLPIRVLGGNILTVVDLFCNNIPQDDRLSLDTFDPIKEKLRGLAGKLLLVEVVEAFIEMIQEQVLSQRTIQRKIQVMILVDDSSLQEALELRLKNEGFGIISQNSPASFVELYKRREPDMTILAVPGEPENVKSLIDELVEGGVSLKSTPTFVLTDCSCLPVTSLLEQGVEDVVFLDDNLDLLFSKIETLEIKMSVRAKTATEIADGTSGSRGRLADMDLFQLLKILGPCRKTVRITIQSNRPGTTGLVLYLNHGQISFAQCNDLTGAEAVYEGLFWSDGSWSVESVATEDLPAPNSRLTNDSILMEGCRLADERIKEGRFP
jgi:DNA-binding response OmpR family regulator